MASETEAKAEVVAVTQGMEQYCAVPALCTCSTENLLWLHRKEKRNTETFCIGDECSASSTTQLYKRQTPEKPTKRYHVDVGTWHHQNSHLCQEEARLLLTNLFSGLFLRPNTPEESHKTPAFWMSTEHLPKAIPPCGGAPNSRASSRWESTSESSCKVT